MWPTTWQQIQYPAKVEPVFVPAAPADVFLDWMALPELPRQAARPTHTGMTPPCYQAPDTVG